MEPDWCGYEVLRPLDDGAVVEGRDASGRPVVLARIPLDGLAERETLRRRLQSLIGFSHPNVVRVLAVEEASDGAFVLAYEALGGTTLATILAARGQLSAGEVAFVWDALASGLGALHERGIIHGDISGANVIVTDEGRPVLIDVCARLLWERGTPGYAAPERKDGGPASAASDIYSLAALLCTLSTDSSLSDMLSDACGPAEGRPNAWDLWARRCEFSEPSPIALPDVPALAAARIRVRIPATEIPSHRREHHVRRRSRMMLRTVSLAGVALIAAGAILTDLTLFGPPGPPTGPVNVVRAYLQARDAALTRRDTDLLAASSRSVRGADRETIARWQREAITVERLETVPTRIDVLERDGLDAIVETELMAIAPTMHLGSSEVVGQDGAVSCRRFWVRGARVEAVGTCDDPADTEAGGEPSFSDMPSDTQRPGPTSVGPGRELSD
ncbi:MAG: protein kinase [Bowdeniella nasicola]|nr:protein kinase [Bowdeniella nasicola]